MNRRGFLKIGGGCVAAVAGGIRLLSPRVDEVHRLRPRNPFPLLVRNHRGERTTAFVVIERDGSNIVDKTLDLGPDESERVLEIDTAGTYTVFVESEEMSEEKEVNVKWEHLTDCNSNYFHLTVNENDVDVSYFWTDLDCNGILWRGS